MFPPIHYGQGPHGSLVAPGLWATESPLLSGVALSLQADANAALAAVLQAHAAAANLGATGRAAALEALTTLRLNNVLAAVLQTVLGGGPTFPLSPLDLPFYRAMLNESDISLMGSLAGLGAVRGLLGRLATQLPEGRSPAGWAGEPIHEGRAAGARVAGALALAGGGPEAEANRAPAPQEVRGCVFCGAEEELLLFRGRLICRSCREQVAGGQGRGSPPAGARG